MQKNEIGHHSNTINKIKLTWIKDLKTVPKVLRLLKKEREKYLWHWPWERYFGYDIISTSNKRKTKQVGLHYRKKEKG